MSVHCLPFPCFNQCKQYLMIRTFRNTLFSQGRSHPELLPLPEQKFFGIVIPNKRPATDSILGMQRWAASSQGSLPASYRLYNQGLTQHVFPAGSTRGPGQQLPFIQQTLKLGMGLSLPLHPACAPSQAPSRLQHGPQAAIRLPSHHHSGAELPSHPAPEICSVLNTWKQRHRYRSLGNVI